MTSVYGVTMMGAKAQIFAQLQSKFEDLDMPSEEREQVGVARPPLQGNLRHASRVCNARSFAELKPFVRRVRA